MSRSSSQNECGSWSSCECSSFDWNPFIGTQKRKRKMNTLVPKNQTKENPYPRKLKKKYPYSKMPKNILPMIPYLHEYHSTSS